MKNYLILSFILVFTLFSANAQHKDDATHECTNACCDTTNKFAPQKGDFTAAMVFGRGAYLNGGLVVPSSNSTVSGAAPFANDVSANDNSVTNMVGAEGRYYASNRFAITLSGGAILRNTPYVLGIPAVGPLPAYQTVVANETIDLNVSIGAQWLFNTKNERLFPYLGIAIPFDYARHSQFDQLNDLGARHVDITAFGVQAVAGVDYYLAKDVFFGFDVKPVSYTYAGSVKTPGPGQLNLESETDTVSFFAQFSFKLGFKF